METHLLRRKLSRNDVFALLCRGHFGGRRRAPKILAGSSTGKLHQYPALEFTFTISVLGVRELNAELDIGEQGNGCVCLECRLQPSFLLLKSQVDNCANSTA